MEKHENVALFSMLRQGKLADLFLVFTARLDKKHFIRIPSLNVSEMSPLGTF